MKKCLLYLLLAVFDSAIAQTDSLMNQSVGRKIYIDGFAASSFFIDKNWKTVDATFLLLSAALNICIKKNSENINRISELRTEICYTKFIDSTWIKNADKIFLSSIWTFGMRTKLRNSFSLSLKTQMTDTWLEDSQWISGPMIPASFIAGYGLNYRLWERSYLNFSFAAMKFQSIPRKNFEEEKKTIIKTQRIIIESEYGFNLQTFIDKNIFKNITWENKSTFFTTGLDREVMTFDMSNAISVRPVKFIKIRLEHKMLYDFLQSSRIQTRYEMLVGYFFKN